MKLKPKEKALGKSLIACCLFTASYLVWASVVAAKEKNSEFVFYIAVLLLLVGVVGWVYRNVKLSTPLMWALSIWGALHMAGGLVPVPDGWPVNGDMRVLYSLWIIPERLKYDHVVHFYGFATTTWLCWECLRDQLARRGNLARSEIAPTFGVLCLCAAAGMGFGAANEVVEFAATLLMPQTNVGGYVNTGWDLVSNLVGSVSAATIIWFGGRHRN